MAKEPGTRNPERFTVTALGNGEYRVADEGGERLAYAAGPRTARWVFLDGQVYVLDVTASGGRPRAGTHDETGLSSPMPATVAIINARPQQDVSQGDVLIVLEAMKMELPIKAPRDGRVKAIACSVGDLVQPGIPLVELE